MYEHTLPPRDWKDDLTQIKCLTINTDASFQPQTKNAGFAFYVICNVFKIMKSGHFNSNIDDSIMAETKCIGNAIATTLNRKDLPSSIETIVINTDCTGAINKIQNSQEAYCVSIRNILTSLMVKTNCKNVSFRHVKAHSNKKDSRSWVNNWCDKEARKWMRTKKKTKN